MCYLYRAYYSYLPLYDLIQSSFSFKSSKFLSQNFKGKGIPCWHFLMKKDWHACKHDDNYYINHCIDWCNVGMGAVKNFLAIGRRNVYIQWKHLLEKNKRRQKENSKKILTWFSENQRLFQLTIHWLQKSSKDESIKGNIEDKRISNF